MNPSGSCGTAPGAERILLAVLFGERSCGKHWSQGESQTHTRCRASGPADGILQMAVGTLGVQVFQRSLQPWYPCLHSQSSPEPLSPGWKAAGCAAEGTSRETLCLCHCCCCCPRNCSQGGFKSGTFSIIWISVVFKRLFVTQSDFSARHMGRSPETLQGGVPSQACLCSCVFLVQCEWCSSSSLQLCAMGRFLLQGSLWLSVAAPELLWLPLLALAPAV